LNTLSIIGEREIKLTWIYSRIASVQFQPTNCKWLQPKANLSQKLLLPLWKFDNFSVGRIAKCVVTMCCFTYLQDSTKANYILMHFISKKGDANTAN